eukprot:TRINITY_DN11313_c0_g1_i3.p1 TRINITY_DN11313_c0_g1~~TRINITY_DN11313_c0_g1_i3.p1  ORF type:complete len:144 (-),score=14.04 TRINITY_DN11313_c0_g1_i3:4-435(-)
MTMRRAFTPIMGRTAFYFADGTGRDLYIANNNGGMTSAKPQGYIMGTRKLPLTNRRIRNTTNYTVTRLSYRAQVFVLSRRRGWERRVYNVRLCKSARANSGGPMYLSLIHISEPTRLGMISYAVFCLKKKKKKKSEKIQKTKK